MIYFFPGGLVLEKYIFALSLRENWLHAFCGGWTCSVLPFWIVQKLCGKEQTFPLLLLSMQAALRWMLPVRRHGDCKEVPGAREGNRYGHCGCLKVPRWTPGACQSHSISPLLNWTGERMYKKRLMDQVKARERSLSNYCHRQNRLDFGKLIYYLLN